METTPEDNQNPEYQDLLDRAAAKYGQGAEFAYPTRDNQFAMLTLKEAVQICGQYMTEVGEDQLWGTLDKFKSLADKISQRSDKLAEAARSVGKQALQDHQPNTK